MLAIRPDNTYRGTWSTWIPSTGSRSPSSSPPGRVLTRSAVPQGIDFAVELEPTGSVGGLTSALLALGGSAFRRTGSFLVYDSPSSGQSIAIASMTQPKCASPPPLSVLGTISETDSRQDGPVPYLPGASIKVGSYRDGLPCPSERDLFLLEMYACGRARTARQRRKHARDAMKLLESITEPTVSAFNINEYDKQLIGGSVQLAAALTGRNEAWWEARLQVPR